MNSVCGDGRDAGDRYDDASQKMRYPDSDKARTGGIVGRTWVGGALRKVLSLPFAKHQSPGAQNPAPLQQTIPVLLLSLLFPAAWKECSCWNLAMVVSADIVARRPGKTAYERSDFSVEMARRWPPWEIWTSSSWAQRSRWPRGAMG